MCRYAIKLLLSNSIKLHGCFFLSFSPKMLTLNMTFILVMVIILHLNSEQCSGSSRDDGRYSCKSCNVGRTSPYVCRDCVLGTADAHYSCGTCRIGAQSSTFNCRRCRNKGPEIRENNLDMYGNSCENLGERLAKKYGFTCKEFASYRIPVSHYLLKLN